MAVGPASAALVTSMKKNDQPAIRRCSFCNKDQNQVLKLIAGPAVFICDECVEVCQDIVSGKYDQPSASDDIAPIAWLQWGRQMTKCRTCGRVWPTERPGTNP